MTKTATASRHSPSCQRLRPARTIGGNGFCSGNDDFCFAGLFAAVPLDPAARRQGHSGKVCLKPTRLAERSSHESGRLGRCLEHPGSKTPLRNSCEFRYEERPPPRLFQEMNDPYRWHILHELRRVQKQARTQFRGGVLQLEIVSTSNPAPLWTECGSGSGHSLRRLPSSSNSPQR